MRRYGVRKMTVKKYGNLLTGIKAICDSNKGLIKTKDVNTAIKTHRTSKMVFEGMKNLDILVRVAPKTYQWQAGVISDDLSKRLANVRYDKGVKQQIDAAKPVEAKSIETPAPRKQQAETRLDPPTLKEVGEYFKNNGFGPKLSKRFIDTYTNSHWVQANGNVIQNWKNVARINWFPYNDPIQQLELPLSAKESPTPIEDESLPKNNGNSDAIKKPEHTTAAFPSAADRLETVRRLDKPKRRIKLLWGLIDITI